MAELRIALILVGLALLLALYFVGRRKHEDYKREDEDFDFSSADLPDPLDPDSPITVQLNNNEDHLPSVDHIEDEKSFAVEADAEAGIVQELGDISDLVREDIAESPRKKSTFKHQPSLLDQQAEELPEQDEKLVILHVAARSPNKFSGSGILKLTKELDLEHDEMQIFNKNIERFSGIKSLYSIVNMVKPGSFDLQDMGQFETPGISFVMHLPGPEEGLRAFNIMLEAAKKFAERLNGDLLDESRTRLSPQTIAHLQEDIQLFSLKNSRAYANK